MRPNKLVLYTCDKVLFHADSLRFNIQLLLFKIVSNTY